MRADLSYTGNYFYARETYIEFLPPNSAAGLGQGSSGVAFGIEVPGGSESVAGVLDKGGLRSFVGPISRELEGEQIPWFTMVGLERAHASSQLNLFSLEYDPQFLAEWHPELPPEGEGTHKGRVCMHSVSDSLSTSPAPLPSKCLAKTREPSFSYAAQAIQQALPSGRTRRLGS